ncbi:hypothetical protein [Stenotrophomonas sp.]|uniref:hypothetical protein n=1 Tax=Stenotrophomonas sp. TaxID=69392 RepID=UPI0031D8BF14
MRNLFKQWMLPLPLLLAACGGKQPPVYGDGFPVAKPMDLVHAGAVVEARFELPPPWEDDPRPRTFLIGFRTGGPPGRPDMKPGDADFLDKAELPLRVQLWKVDGSDETPVVLHRLNPSTVPGSPVFIQASSDVFPMRSPTGADSNSLVKVGKYDMSMAYRQFEVASATAESLSPGRYRLQVTNLQQNSRIAHLKVELLVANYNVK